MTVPWSELWQAKEGCYPDVSLCCGKMSERVQSTAQFVAPVHWSESEKSSFPFKVSLKKYAAHLIMPLHLYSRPAQIFFGKLGQTPRSTFGQIMDRHQFSASSDIVWPRLRSSEGPQVRLIMTAFRTFGASEAWSNDVRGGWKLVSSHNLAKRRPWSLSQFSKKKLGWPNVHSLPLFLIR